MVEQYGYKEESEYEQESVSVKEIVLRHIRKISDICCQELTGGYWTQKPVKSQSGILFTEVYHEDKREAYCNAVDFLIDILYPDSDKEFKKYIEDNENIDKEIEDIKKRMLKKRKTFKQINIMFSRTNYWKGSESGSE